MAVMTVSAYAASNVGKRRQNNEDNFYLNGKCVNSANDIRAEATDLPEAVFSVCDGMGGEEAGEVASQFAVQELNEAYQFLLNNHMSDAAINRYVKRANALVCEEISRRKKRLGTTCTLLGIQNDTVTATNIGDSRIYRYSSGNLQQISHDHTEAQTMVDSGTISAEKAMTIPEKHRLTQHIGIFPEEMLIEPYTVRIPARAGDRYLLCSDGLTDMLTDAEIQSVLQSGQSLQITTERLISQALEKGGRDNVTVVLCEINDMTGFATITPPMQNASLPIPDHPDASPMQTADNKSFVSPAPEQSRKQKQGRSKKAKLIILCAFLVILVGLVVLIGCITGARKTDKTPTTVFNAANNNTTKGNTSSVETTTVPDSSSGTYVVDAGGQDLKLHSTYSTEGKILTTIPDGTELVVESTKNGWGYVTYNGKTGWVEMEYLKEAKNSTAVNPPSDKTTAATNDNRLGIDKLHLEKLIGTPIEDALAKYPVFSKNEWGFYEYENIDLNTNTDGIVVYISIEFYSKESSYSLFGISKDNSVSQAIGILSDYGYSEFHSNDDYYYLNPASDICVNIDSNNNGSISSIRIGYQQ